MTDKIYSEEFENDNIVIDLNKNSTENKLKGYKCIYTYDKDQKIWVSDFINKPENTEKIHLFSLGMSLRHLFIEEKHGFILKKIILISYLSISAIIVANIFLFLKDSAYKEARNLDFIVCLLHIIGLWFVSKSALTAAFNYFYYPIPLKSRYIIIFSRPFNLMLFIQFLSLVLYNYNYYKTMSEYTYITRIVLYERLSLLSFFIIFFGFIYAILGFLYIKNYEKNIR